MIHTEEILLILQIAYLERKKTYIIFIFWNRFSNARNTKLSIILFLFQIQFSILRFNQRIRILPKSNFTEKKPRLQSNQMPKSTLWQKFDLSGKEITINNEMSCHNRNLIYAITCSVYGELYIVETGNTLRERKRINKQHINLPEYRIIKLSGVIWTYVERNLSQFSPL